MAFLEINNVSISGIAACVPKQVVNTDDYAFFSSDAEKKLFIQTTGIKTHRKADHHICTSDLCFKSAEQLLKDLQWNVSDISILIFVSQSPDYFLPATSVLLQEKLNLPKTCMAFDINLGCSGYVYGLSVISSLLEKIPNGKALLLVGDKSTSSPNPKDKTTAPLFGDAGTATALENRSGKMVFNLQSDGSGKNAIMIPGGATRNPYHQNSLVDEQIQNGIVRNECNLILDGAEVFNFSLREVKPNIDQLAEKYAISIPDIDYFVFHQANKLMMESIRKKMKIDSDKFPINIDHFGNTSSASIPLTVVTELRSKLKIKSQKLIFSGFGVGFSWASVYLESNTNWVCPELIEI